MQDYSAIIRLIPNRCTRYIENLSPEAEYFTSATPKYRNLVSRATELGDLVYVQFDPAQYLVDEIQVKWRTKYLVANLDSKSLLFIWGNFL
jgi:hypothetical protein